MISPIARSRITASAPPTGRAAWYALGSLVLGAHLGLLAAGHVLIHRELRARTPPEAHAALASAVTAHATQRAADDLIAIGLAALLVAVVLAQRHSAAAPRIVALWLVAQLPHALYGAGVVVAFVAGWQLDVWVISSRDATAPQIAATIEQALPIVLEPFAAGRLLATAAAIALFVWIGRRLGPLPLRPSFATAAAAAAGVTVAYLLG